MDGCMDYAHAVERRCAEERGYELPQRVKDELVVLELSVTWAQS